MNILFLSTTYPTPARPRQGAFNHHLVRALRVRHDVRVIAPIPWTQAAPHWRPRRSGGKIDRAGCGRIDVPPRLRRGDGQHGDRFPTFWYPPKLLRRHYDLFYWWSIQPTLRELSNSFVPELVIGYWLHPDAGVAARIARRCKVPSLALSGGSDLRVLPQNRTRRQAVQRVLAQVDRLAVVSRDLAVQAAELGMPPDRTEIVYRGIDKQCFLPGDRLRARQACGISQDAVVLLWVGRLEPVKNPELLLDAVVELRKRFGNRLCVLMAGAGLLAMQLRAQRSKLGLEDCVRFVGELNQHDLSLRYNAADLTVLTSRSEGIPNVLLESIACGVPFVATDVGGVSEIATPGLDQLVPDGDARQLAAAIAAQIDRKTSPPRIFQPDGLNEMAARFDAVFDRLTAPKHGWQNAALATSAVLPGLPDRPTRTEIAR